MRRVALIVLLAASCGDEGRQPEEVTLQVVEEPLDESAGPGATVVPTAVDPPTAIVQEGGLPVGRWETTRMCFEVKPDHQFELSIEVPSNRSTVTFRGQYQEDGAVVTLGLLEGSVKELMPCREWGTRGMRPGESVDVLGLTAAEGEELVLQMTLVDDGDLRICGKPEDCVVLPAV